MELATGESRLTLSEDERQLVAAVVAATRAVATEYADPGYQEDGEPRYPIDTEEHVRAAWSYINMPRNARKYTREQLARIKARIKAAGKKYGIHFSDDDEAQGASAALDLQEHEAIDSEQRDQARELRAQLIALLEGEIAELKQGEAPHTDAILALLAAIADVEGFVRSHTLELALLEDGDDAPPRPVGASTQTAQAARAALRCPSCGAKLTLRRASKITLEAHAASQEQPAAVPAAQTPSAEAASKETTTMPLSTDEIQGIAAAVAAAVVQAQAPLLAALREAVAARAPREEEHSPSAESDHADDGSETLDGDPMPPAIARDQIETEVPDRRHPGADRPTTEPESDGAEMKPIPEARGEQPAPPAMAPQHEGEDEEDEEDEEGAASMRDGRARDGHDGDGRDGMNEEDGEEGAEMAARREPAAASQRAERFTGSFDLSKPADLQRYLAQFGATRTVVAALHSQRGQDVRASSKPVAGGQVDLPGGRPAETVKAAFASDPFYRLFLR